MVLKGVDCYVDCRDLRLEGVDSAALAQGTGIKLLDALDGKGDHVAVFDALEFSCGILSQDRVDRLYFFGDEAKVGSTILVPVVLTWLELTDGAQPANVEVLDVVLEGAEGGTVTYCEVCCSIKTKSTVSTQ